MAAKKLKTLAARKRIGASKTCVSQNASSPRGSELGSTVDVLIRGIADLQFDHYSGKEVEKGATVDLADLMYLDEHNGLVMPADNIGSFFYSANYPSCVNMFWGEMKTRKTVLQSFKAQVFPEPQQIPILDDNEQQIIYHGFKKNSFGRLVDEKARLYVDKSLPRVKGAVVPNPNKQRPTLRKPWMMRFQLRVFEIGGSNVTTDLVRAYLQRGGLMIGIGTHRPMFGRFAVERFKVL